MGTPGKSPRLKKKKRVPKLKTDKAAERFLAQELSGVGLSAFRASHFEFDQENKQMNAMPDPKGES